MIASKEHPLIFTALDLLATADVATLNTAELFSRTVFAYLQLCSKAGAAPKQCASADVAELLNAVGRLKVSEKLLQQFEYVMRDVYFSRLCVGLQKSLVVGVSLKAEKKNFISEKIVIDFFTFRS